MPLIVEGPDWRENAMNDAPEYPMNELKTEVHNLSVVFPAKRWLPESRMTMTFIPMGGNLYRLNEGFLCGPISFGDVIEVLPTDQKDVVLFQRRVKRAGLKRACYIMPRDMAEKPCFAELMSRIQDSRGFAAVDFQGVFLVFLPKTCNLDVNLELKRIAGVPKSTRLHLLKSRVKWRLQ